MDVQACPRTLQEGIIGRDQHIDTGLLRDRQVQRICPAQAFMGVGKGSVYALFRRRDEFGGLREHAQGVDPAYALRVALDFLLENGTGDPAKLTGEDQIQNAGYGFGLCAYPGLGKDRL